jgi:hypothetical protein
MKKHPWTYAIGTLVAAVVALTVWLVAGPVGKNQNDQNFFPQQMDDRIAWPTHPPKSDEYKEKCCRHYIMAADGISHIGATVDYENGNTGYEKFRWSRNGVDNIESVTIKYPLKEGDREAQVARELQLDLDGHTFLKDRRYSPTGVVTTVGDRKGENKYTQVDYTDDGMNVKRHQDFLLVTTDDFSGKKAKWVTDLDEQYDVNHNLDSWTQRRDDGAMVIKKFASGKLVTRSMESKDHDQKVTEYYDVDGTTVVKKVEQRYYYVTITTLKNGVPVVDWKFSDYNLVVNIYDEQGHPHLRQTWEPRSWGDAKTDGKYDQSKLKLEKLDYLDATGEELKTITFQEDGVNPDEIRIRDPQFAGKYNPSTVKKFRADGTLSDITEYNDSGDKVKTESHTVDEKIHETIDPSDVAPRPFDQPPEPMPTPKFSFRWF